MASYRKVHKHRWMCAKPILDQIKSYGYKFEYKLWGGDYCFNIKSEDCNFIITFKDLPDMKFGIWINTDYGDKKDCFFAEHIVYDDKFRPSRVAFNWDSLDEMMNNVIDWINNPWFYKSEMCSAYKIDNWDEFCQDTVNQHYWNTHHQMDKDKFVKNINKFNQIINSINPEDYDIIYKPAFSYGDLFDVYCYYSPNLYDDEINDFENQLEDCGCTVWGAVLLPPYYWNHRKKYKLVVHPENKRLYTDRKYHERYFRKLKK